MLTMHYAFINILEKQIFINLYCYQKDLLQVTIQGGSIGGF